MTFAISKISKILVGLALPVIFLVMPGANAQASTLAYAFYEQNRPVCMVANQDAVYDQGNCPGPSTVNHVGLWIPIQEGTDPATGNEMYVLKNVHFGDCLTINDTGGPYGATCPTGSGLNGVNHVQLWILVPAGGSSVGDAIVNIHTRHSLFWSSSSSAITQTGSGPNSIWNVGETSV